MFCLNLGGFANISFDKRDKRIAYDICPVNIVLNHYVKPLGLNYDDKGILSRSGSVNLSLLKALNSLEFYNKPYPKSLGLEWVKAHVFPLIDSYGLPVKDSLRTYTEHIAIQIAAQLDQEKDKTILVTGGGAFNDFFNRKGQGFDNP